MKNRIDSKYKMILSPIVIKNLIFTNRLCSSPMGTIPTHTTITSTDFGGVSIFDKAAGGVGMVPVAYHGRSGITSYEANGGNPFSNKYELDILRDQLNMAKRAGALVGISLGMTQIYEGTLYSPSGLAFAGRPAEKITEEIIERQVALTAEKASKALDFGFDLLILDIACDNIAAQFMAPVFNKRIDRWGGRTENRLRLPLYLIDRVRSAVGDNAVIMLRLSMELAIEGSYTVDEAMQLIKAAESKIDIVNPMIGMDEYHEANVKTVSMIFEPHMNTLEYARRIKQETDLLVCLGGGVMTPQEAEDAVDSESADFVMFGRSLIADPYWPKKLLENREEDIVPCIRCNQCYHIATGHFNTACSVNPRYRRENVVPLKPEKTDIPKSVVVIGAGPAGITAALTADKRGHKVLLIEKDSRSGGLLNSADCGKYKTDLHRYNEYLKTQIDKSAVEVRYNTFATPGLLKSLKPDAVIVAVGSSPILPKIEGAENSNVIQAVELHANTELAGENVVIIGGGAAGCELALELADQGRTVTIIELSEKLASNGNMLYRINLMQHIDSTEGITYMCRTKCVRITDHSIIVIEGVDEKELEADTVVLSVGMKSNLKEAEKFFGIVPQTYYTGDCKKVATVLEAVNHAYFIALSL